MYFKWDRCYIDRRALLHQTWRWPSVPAGIIAQRLTQECHDPYVLIHIIPDFTTGLIISQFNPVTTILRHWTLWRRLNRIPILNILHLQAVDTPHHLLLLATVVSILCSFTRMRKYGAPSASSDEWWLQRLNIITCDDATKMVAEPRYEESIYFQENV